MQQKLFQQAVDYPKREVEINPKLSSTYAELKERLKISAQRITQLFHSGIPDKKGGK